MATLWRLRRANYMKEVKAEEAAAANVGPIQYDLEDLEDDPELHALHKERIQQMKEEQEKRREMERKGHGTYNGRQRGRVPPRGDRILPGGVATFITRSLSDAASLTSTSTSWRRSISTPSSSRCTPRTPFVTKLNIQVLPCIIFFRNGVAYDRIVGFEELGARTTSRRPSSRVCCSTRG